MNIIYMIRRLSKVLYWYMFAIFTYENNDQYLYLQKI